MDTTDDTRDLREDTDADTRDVIEDTDADTRDMSEEVTANARDDAELIRKIDSLMESVSALSQAIAQIAHDSGTNPPATDTPDTTDEDATPLEDLDYSL